MTKRWFNYRPICLTFLFLILGTVFAFYLIDYKVATIIISTVVLLLILAFAIFKNKLRYFFIPFLAFIVGACCYYIAAHKFAQSLDAAPKFIEARIYAIRDEENGQIKVNVENCLFDNIKTNDNISLTIYDNSGLFENIEVGNIIKFSPTAFYHSDLFYHDTPNSKMFSENLKYAAFTNIDKVEKVGENKTLAEKVKSKIKTNLLKGLTNENTELAYSSLFGDKELLDESQYESFQLSGVAHLLAVSGLHVGIITAVLYKLLDWCRVRRWPRFILVAIILLFYAYICNFSVSVVRASIMALVLLLSDIFFREYDTLNSLSIAGIVIFALNPLCAFDAGFLMSFSCVLGISMLMSPLKELLIKTKMNKKLAEALAISLSTNITLMFIMAYFFGRLNLISIVANLIIIPMFTLAFTVVFICAILSLILPFITVILYPINYLFSVITILSTVFANVPFANFAVGELHFLTILVYVTLLLVMSRFCVAKNKEKVFASLPLFALLVVCLV